MKQVETWLSGKIGYNIVVGHKSQQLVSIPVSNLNS